MPNQELTQTSTQSRPDVTSVENAVARVGLFITGVGLVGLGHWALASVTLIGVLPTTQILNRL